MAEATSMRIIAGDYRGRKLISPKGQSVRPTADRVREAIFNILGDVTDCRCLDLFAGTGAVSFEALSRGAATVTLVDKNLRHARRNADLLSINERVRWKNLDMSRFLASNTSDTYDIIFVDPPYDLALDIHSQVLEFAEAALETDGILLFEHPKKCQLSELCGTMQRSQIRLYGDTAISFYERSNS